MLPHTAHPSSALREPFFVDGRKKTENNRAP